MITIQKFRKILWHTITEIFLSGCIGYAKEAAYSLILSFFPMLLFCVALFAVLGRNYINEITLILYRVLPLESRSLVIGYLENFFKNQPPKGLLFIAAIATILPAAGLMVTLSKALDHIYNNTKRRSLWAEQIMAYTMVLVIGTPLLIATVATAAGTHFEQVIIHSVGNKKIFGLAWVAGRWAIILLTVMFIAMLLYRFAPSRIPAWRHVFPGAAIASVLWIIITWLFGVYVAHFSSYNRIYGSLGAGIILLVWMYFTSLVIMIGAIFNRQCEIHLGRSSIQPNNTFL